MLINALVMAAAGCALIVAAIVLAGKAIYQMIRCGSN